MDFILNLLLLVPNNPGMAPNTMAAGMPGARVINPQALEQQKLLQQQQLLRAQQQQIQQQQQQHMIGMTRPPPPDYKTSAAGLIHGMQPRYPSNPTGMRRMPHQPMPPSGILGIILSISYSFA